MRAMISVMALPETSCKASESATTFSRFQWGRSSFEFVQFMYTSLMKKEEKARTSPALSAARFMY